MIICKELISNGNKLKSDFNEKNTYQELKNIYSMERLFYFFQLGQQQYTSAFSDNLNGFCI